MNMFHTFVPTRIINGHAVDITGQVADDHIIPVKFLQKRAKLLYQFVPRHDSQSVIYLAEIININNKHADQPVILFGPTKKFGQKTHKIITVVQSGQTVVIRHVEKLFVLCFLFGDILYHNNLIRRPAIFVENPAGKLQPGLLSPLHTFHRVRLPTALFQKQHFPKCQHIRFVHHLLKFYKISSVQNLEVKKIIPFSQRSDRILFKRIVDISIIHGIAQQTIHSLLSALFLIHCAHKIQLIA